MVATLTAAFMLWSPAFQSNHAIPRRFACDGADISPPLRWTAPPRGTKAFALLAVDVDGGAFTHWTLWDLPASTRSLAGGAKWRAQGTNTFRRIGYGGPCPPRNAAGLPGPRHRYFFTLYALRRRLGLPRGASPAQFVRALAGHLIATATISGTYRR